MDYLDLYKKEIVPAFKKEFGFTNDLAVPRLEKIVLNIGTGDSLSNDKEKETLLAELSAISGQKPSIRRAKKAIAGFKIRQGDPVGVKATLRGKRMYDFLHKLVSIVLPRVRDFRGLDYKSIDKLGGFSLGFREHIVFPEIDVAKIGKYRGLQVTVATTSKDPKQTKRLLELFGVPFKKEETKG
ncbi:MAG: 50S ribosomal protein L5 [Candidatus Woykebacteria bacterium RIFCSPHIGHO2_12_FULL_43_10]|uniref:Large ribosomal subunit protein uL5 n=2 Tax=Candidatus Woykeibacteriota TaxID=1817899 RepID=A0A1G1WZ83_9BACT|nr:MAG: 50S ribosomal protein L5 [Candidatus Woykebacteria bacterium RIFCSPHIGHO2_01_FULL_43_29]OGY28708.1 MAG: 50S ribosomal protein L5 [Candidatus Woykebacteria bacterium RIFCSPHIGHO2_02_FULL_43_16b]OGY29783.1 MAG: 50S ribosomal protein L5 [Candidatus Woykebacteria bacterium RIFCSPHIGHO2_12_FULL_43_10]OGY32457.1 MAG: 50S ribosomal protein L5 [Candidatus Woykebacteria bacterium RIFCSPLOWO2_01_FULL_43_14]